MSQDTQTPPRSRLPSPGVPASAPGTRDLYPADALLRRFLTEAWRTVSLRHGFDEVDGPAFENLSIYEARSGPEITNRLFTFKRSGGVHQFALRPEFTPTLARMFAERHASLPLPVRWFSTGNCFRAERPGNGRLREFWQWNLDIVGDPTPEADAEVLSAAIALLRELGLGPRDVRVKLSSREVVAKVLTGAGVRPDRLTEAFEALDLRGKVSRPHMVRTAAALGFELNAYESVAAQVAAALQQRRYDNLLASASAAELGALGGLTSADLYQLADLARALDARGLLDWCDLDLSVVCGIAYYTGTVFQIRAAADGQRLIASGGRYDNLIQALGGPPTPAVGFGMTDDQLAAALADADKLPSPGDLRVRLGAAPQVVIAAETPSELATRALQHLRDAGIHARPASAGTEAAITVRASDDGQFHVQHVAGRSAGPVGLALLATTVRTVMAP